MLLMFLPLKLYVLIYFGFIKEKRVCPFEIKLPERKREKYIGYYRPPLLCAKVCMS